MNDGKPHVLANFLFRLFALLAIALTISARVIPTATAQAGLAAVKIGLALFVDGLNQPVYLVQPDIDDDGGHYDCGEGGSPYEGHGRATTFNAPLPRYSIRRLSPDVARDSDLDLSGR